MQFDFALAWDKLALPCYRLLPEAVHALIIETGAVAADCQQDATLDTVWPEGETGEQLRKKYSALSSDVLAVTARVIHSFGHWMPGRSTVVADDELIALRTAIQRTGTYWKIANYCDQILRARCTPPISRRRSEPNGVSYAVHEGFLRVQFSSRDGWTWEEIGLGTPETYATASGILPVGGTEKAYTAALPKLRKLQSKGAPGLIGGRIAEFFDLSIYDSSPKAQALRMLRDVTAPAGWSVKSVEAVNFVPHPFMITSRHVERASYGVLDPSVAPCGWKGCGLDYSEHTHEVAALIQTPYPPTVVESDPLPEDVRLWLKAVIEAGNTDAFRMLEKKPLDGVLLLRSEAPE